MCGGLGRFDRHAKGFTERWRAWRLILLHSHTLTGSAYGTVLRQREWFTETTEEDLCVGCYLLDLLGVFVADEDNYWINVNTVEPFDGVRGNVEQTVTALHPKTKTKARL